ncbi:leucine-rich repeat protein [Streptococcus pseudopneumoniae]|uniref:leucine-rich repeat protein n=1 Tax=Streptococcus pseudopneumoniae TaxID=257758 RepID=UPI00110C3176|nr:leucine-rich repeat protein [Streptococcus pseudopneumoniae]TMR65685.1 choline-binding protein A [Streptococcus pseudopneumoniae]
MKKTTILSLTTAAVILAAYVPNEPILADTPSSEVIKETKVGSIIQQNNIKYKVLTVEGNIGTVQVGNGVTPVEFEAGQDGKPFTIPTKITVGDKVFTVTEVASQAFSYYPDETGRIVYYPSSITIPSSIKKIQKKGFHGSKAKTIIFDKGSQLEKIEDRAFDFSELEEIELPASLEYIGTSAFSFSQKLKKLTFSSSSKLELISHEAFANLSNLEKLTLPKSVKTLGSNLFRLTTSLKHVDVEEGNESFASVDGVLFSKDKTQLIYYPSQKNDESYKTPKETKELASYSFNKNSYLKKLELNEGLEKIGTFAFADAIKLEEISLPNSLETIERLAFYGNLELKELILPDNVKNFGKHVMNGLPKLKSLTIGNNINSLPSFFLSGVLDSLKEIHIKNKSTEFSVKKDTFAIPETVKFYVTSEHIKDVLKSNLSTSNDIIVEKVDNIKQETDVAKPKEGTGKTETDVAKPKEGTGKTETDVAKPKEGTGKTETDVAKPKEGTGKTETDVAKPKEGTGKTETDVAKPKKNSNQGVVGWVKDKGLWYYLNESGSMATGWVKDKGLWYYLNESGSMATGWVKDKGLWYYLNESGSMATGWIKDKGLWYYLNESGSMATGWVKDKGSWYYLDTAGAMKTGWFTVSGKWYYTYNSGDLLVNTTTPDGYRVNANGEWVG